MRVAAHPPARFDAVPDSPLILRDGSVAAVRTASSSDQQSMRTFSAEEAAAAATAVGLPVVAKLSAPTIVHKSEVDGAGLNLTTPEVGESV